MDITGKVIESGAQDTRGFDVLPTPEPTVAPDDTPFITWGQIDGTPFRLDGGDVPLAQDGAPTFKLPEPTKRELIAHEMVEKIKRNNQAKRAFSQQMTQKLRWVAFRTEANCLWLAAGMPTRACRRSAGWPCSHRRRTSWRARSWASRHG